MRASTQQTFTIGEGPDTDKGRSVNLTSFEYFYSLPFLMRVTGSLKLIFTMFTEHYPKRSATSHTLQLCLPSFKMFITEILLVFVFAIASGRALFETWTGC